MPCTTKQPRTNKSNPYENTLLLQTMKACKEAFANRNEDYNLEPYQPDQPTIRGCIEEAQRWLDQSCRLQRFTEQHAYYYLGQAIEEAAQTVQKERPQADELELIAATNLGVTDEQATTALRIHKVFQYHPNALKHMQETTIADWERLDDNEAEYLAEVMHTDYPEETTLNKTETTSEASVTSQTEFGTIEWDQEHQKYVFQAHPNQEEYHAAYHEIRSQQENSRDQEFPHCPNQDNSQQYPIQDTPRFSPNQDKAQDCPNQDISQECPNQDSLQKRPNPDCPIQDTLDQRPIQDDPNQDNLEFDPDQDSLFIYPNQDVLFRRRLTYREYRKYHSLNATFQL